MSQPPPRKAISLDDLPGAPPWLEKVLGPINAFIQPTGAGLDRGLTFRENFAGAVTQVDVSAPDDWTEVTWANSWTSNTAYGPAAWRQGLDGRVYLRGVGQRTGSPTAGTPFITGLPKPAFLETLASQTDAGPGTADLGTDGTLTYYSGGVMRWPLSALSYDAANRTPPRWAKPVDVRLGSKDKPFPGKPGYVLVFRAPEKGTADGYAVVQSVDWSPVTLDAKERTVGVRLHRVWGLRPLVSYNLVVLVLPE